ncbi:MAG: threonine/serine exporter family protein [Deltaproteobacteria bacterium]|nr:threonine/serine exporter family protein [Deltaproteobacteria bacterium]
MSEPDDILPAPSGGPIGPARVLERAELADAIDLVLWIGQLLLEHGAHASQVEQTIVHVGAALGCDKLDVLVSPNALVVTTTEGEDFRTKIRRITRLHVDLTAVVAVNDAARATLTGELDRVALRERLGAIARARPAYPRWLVVAMVGLGCAAFARLFGGELLACAATFVAAAIGLVVRQELTRRKVNAVLVVVLTAFVAGTTSAGLLRLMPGAHARDAIVASVLLLVPGVSLINAVDDLARGHGVIAMTRGFHGLVISLAIAVGLLLGLALVGSPAL